MKTVYKDVRLADCCSHFGDGDWIETKDQSPDGIRLVQTGNVGEGEYKDKAHKARFISDETFGRLRCTEVLPGDCLVSRLPEPVGRACIVPDSSSRMITGVDCSIIRLNGDRLLPPYFVYYSQSDKYLSAVEAATTGTTRSRISRKNLGGIAIPVPPVSEQQRIVAILDEAFGGIAVARDAASRNLTNAHDLFLAQLRTPDAATVPLGDLVAIRSGKLDSTAAVEGGEYPFFTCARTVSAIDTYAFDCEAILLAGNNAVGEFNVKHYKGRFNARQRTYVITVCDENRLLARYLYFQLLGSLGTFKSQAVGTGTKFIRLGMVKSLEIALPNLLEQHRAVERIDSVREATAHLEHLYESKLASFDALKKSLLNEAFAGNL